MNRFVANFQEFPDLSFEVGMEATNQNRVTHRVIVVARGSLASREVWERQFDSWCALQGQVPKFRRGSSLIGRTVAYVLFPGTHPIVDFIVRWVGVEAILIDRSIASRVSQLERAVATLQRRAVQPLFATTQGAQVARD